MVNKVVHWDTSSLVTITPPLSTLVCLSLMPYYLRNWHN
jgi:hypothetical protein